jgi:hypothetical protein
MWRQAIRNTNTIHTASTIRISWQLNDAVQIVMRAAMAEGRSGSPASSRIFVAIVICIRAGAADAEASMAFW